MIGRGNQAQLKQDDLHARRGGRSGVHSRKGGGRQVLVDGEEEFRPRRRRWENARVMRSFRLTAVVLLLSLLGDKTLVAFRMEPWFVAPASRCPVTCHTACFIPRPPFAP